MVDTLGLNGYHPFHATRGDLLNRLGHRDEAGQAYQRAAALTPNPAEHAYLTRRAREPNG